MTREKSNLTSIAQRQIEVIAVFLGSNCQGHIFILTRKKNWKVPFLRNGLWFRLFMPIFNSVNQGDWDKYCLILVNTTHICTYLYVLTKPNFPILESKDVLLFSLSFSFFFILESHLIYPCTIKPTEPMTSYSFNRNLPGDLWNNLTGIIKVLLK